MTPHDDAAPVHPAIEAGAPPAPARSTGARRRTWLIGALVLGVVLVHLPALRTPFFLDDYAQMAMADGQYPGHHGVFDLYDFIDHSNRSALMDTGVFPWWTDTTLVVRFLRPLSSALLWADHRVFGRDALLFHLHSLLWWVAACLAAGAVFRRSFTPRVALLATTAFALSPCHILPLAWIANREALVSTALGALALAAYSRWRERGRALDGVGSLALFGLALAAGEYTLCFTGYVLALEAVRWRDGLLRRVAGLACFAVPVAVYLVAHARLGYGAHGGGLYHDPIHDFGAYAQGAPRRLAVLLTSAWLGTDDGWWGQAPAWALALLLVTAAGLLAAPVARALRGLAADQRARATWMLAGSLVSLAPVLAVEPSRRLLGVSTIGVSAIAALVIDAAWFPAGDAAPARRGVAELSSLAALGLAFVFLVRGPIDTLALGRAVAESGALVRERMIWVRDRIGSSDTVVALRANSPSALLFSPFTIDRETPVRWRLLTYASGRSLLLRTSERSVELVASPNPLFPVGPRELFRNYNQSLRAGDVVNVADMRVTIVQVDENGSPRRIRYEFDRDLDDPSMLWVAEGLDAFREEKLPPKGYGEPILP
jgi:hypothetical protein